MELKNHNWQERFAYMYLAFAHITDDELSNIELQRIKEKIIFWGSEDQAMQEFRDVMHNAIIWYRSEKEDNKRIDMVLEIAKKLIHAPWFDMKHKNRVIADLIDIALVDEKLLENEKDWISKMASIWGIEVEF